MNKNLLFAAIFAAVGFSLFTTADAACYRTSHGYLGIYDISFLWSDDQHLVTISDIKQVTKVITAIGRYGGSCRWSGKKKAKDRANLMVQDCFIPTYITKNIAQQHAKCVNTARVTVVNEFDPEHFCLTDSRITNKVRELRDLGVRDTIHVQMQLSLFGDTAGSSRDVYYKYDTPLTTCSFAGCTDELLSLPDQELWNKAREPNTVGEYCRINGPYTDGYCNYYAAGRNPITANGIGGIPHDDRGTSTGCLYGDKSPICFSASDRIPDITQAERNAMCTDDVVANGAATIRWAIKRGFCTDIGEDITC